MILADVLNRALTATIVIETKKTRAYPYNRVKIDLQIPQKDNPPDIQIDLWHDTVDITALTWPVEIDDAVEDN